MPNKILFKDFKKACAKGMKVLHLDCETSPLEIYTFSIGKTVLSHKQIKTPSRVLCVQYKWEGEGKAKYTESQLLAPGKIDDTDPLVKVSELINEADIVIGQNLDQFDIKVLNGRLAERRLTPITYENTLDILKLSRQSFRFASHKLDFRSKYFGRTGKDPMELQDWVDIMEGKRSIGEKMGPYGCRDVQETQAVFYREFDYYKRIPAKIEKIIRSFIEDPRAACPKCSSRRQSRYNTQFLGGTKYQCLNCNFKFKDKKRTK